MVNIGESRVGAYDSESEEEYSAPPKPPTNVTVNFRQVEKKKGRRIWALVVDWDAVTEDENNDGITVDRYVVKVRPTNNAGTNISIANGGGWRKKTIHDPGDTDDETDPSSGGGEDVTKAVFSYKQNAKTWKWKVRVKAIDHEGEHSTWSTETTPSQPGSPSLAAIPNVVVNKSDKFVRIRWDSNDPSTNDDHGESRLHDDFDYYVVILKGRKRVDGAWVELRRTKTRSNRIVFKRQFADNEETKPVHKNFRATVWGVDTEGFTSAQVADVVQQEAEEGTAQSGGGGSAPAPAPPDPAPAPLPAGDPSITMLSGPVRAKVRWRNDNWQGRATHFHIVMEKWPDGLGSRKDFHPRDVGVAGPGWYETIFDAAKPGYWHRAWLQAWGPGGASTVAWTGTKKG